MHATADTLESMDARARTFVAPPVVVEVRATKSGYDTEVGRPRAVLAVSVVLAAPGDEDSRYRIEHLGRLDADDPAAAYDALGTARRLAERLGAPLHPPSPEPPTADAPGWLAQQGPSPQRPWPMAWRTTVWRPDGTTVDEEQERTVVAASGREALHHAYIELSRGLVPPFEYTVSASDLGRPSSSYRQAAHPTAAPPPDTLRTFALDGRSLAAILRGMTVEAAGLTPLDVMVALEHAFLIELGDLAAAGAFCRGELSDDELQAALGPAVAAQRPRWSLPDALRRTHARGESIGPVLHRHYRDVGGMIPLFIALRDAFDLSLSASKALVETACDGLHDDELIVMLQRAVGALAAGDRDDYRAMFATPLTG